MIIHMIKNPLFHHRSYSSSKNFQIFNFSKNIEISRRILYFEFSIRFHFVKSFHFSIVTRWFWRKFDKRKNILCSSNNWKIFFLKFWEKLRDLDAIINYRLWTKKKLNFSTIRVDRDIKSFECIYILGR